MPSQSSVTTPERTTGILRNEKLLWGQKGKAENSPVQKWWVGHGVYMRKLFWRNHPGG